MTQRFSAIRNALPALALAAGLAGNAGAVDINLGTLTGTSFVQAYTYSPGVVVNDVFHFDLSAPSASSFSAAVTQVSLLNFFNIENLAVDLSQPLGPTLHFAANGPVVLSGLQLLPAGNGYALSVSGTANGLFGGGYSVLMAAAATPPVPEPAQWLLMLMGLLMVLVAAQRRRRAAAHPAQDAAALA